MTDDEKDEDLDEIVERGMIPSFERLPEVSFDDLQAACEGGHEPDDPKWILRDFVFRVGPAVGGMS